MRSAPGECQTITKAMQMTQPSLIMIIFVISHVQTEPAAYFPLPSQESPYKFNSQFTNPEFPPPVEGAAAITIWNCCVPTPKCASVIAM